jgi:hypothetical protein
MSECFLEEQVQGRKVWWNKERLNLIAAAERLKAAEDLQ